MDAQSFCCWRGHCHLHGITYLILFSIHVHSQIDLFSKVGKEKYKSSESILSNIETFDVKEQIVKHSYLHSLRPTFLLEFGV